MKFNKEQLEAINSDSDRIVCVAGAGSGKSSVMIERIRRIIEKDKVDPSSILALTFTNNAALNMLEKYKLNSKSLKLPEFRTFHAFAYSLIVKDEKVRDRLGYTRVPRIADDSDLKRLEETAKQQCGIKLSRDKMSGKRALSPKEYKEFQIYQKALNKLIRAEDLITFDMMSADICELFKSNDESVFTYKHQYKYIFVDEFQDTDSIQFQFIGSFPDGTHWFVVGDPLQNLYSWRGTSNEMLKMLIDSPDWTTIHLYNNYRSTTQIVEYANKFSKSYAKPEHRIEMKAQREGDCVRVVPFATPTFSTPLDIAHEQELLKILKSNAEETAILCRTNNEVNYIIDLLEDNNIKCNKHQSSLDINAIFKCCNDNDYFMNYLSTLLSSEQYSEYIRLSAIEISPDIRWFARLYGNIASIKRIGNLVIEIRKLLSSTIYDPKYKCETLLSMFKLDVDMSDFMPIHNKSKILNYVLEKSKIANSSSITVETIHGSKGLEYDRVIVVNADTDLFQIHDSEDESNIFYVAITRAKNHLIVFKG